MQLPVVKPEIGYSIDRELQNVVDDAEYVRDQLKRLDKENPTVAQFIRRLSKLSKDKIHVAYCGLIVYRMLESQSEVNWMNEDLFI